MSEDVKPRLKTTDETFGLMARTEIVNWIELEPTMRMMDELAEAISNWKKQVETYGGDYLPGNYNQLSNSLEKYKKFKDGLK